MLAREVTYREEADLSLSIKSSDEDLIAACVAGDDKAWESLIEKYSRLIYSIPFRHGLSDSEAADVFQSVCLKLLENLHSLRDCTKLSSWLITTTSRECWSVTKKRAKFPQTVTDDSQEDHDQLDLSPLPDETVILLGEHQAVREAVLSLPSRCQYLIGYLFYNRSTMSYAEIGGRLGIPSGSVGPLRARCLEKLRSMLEESHWT